MKNYLRKLISLLSIRLILLQMLFLYFFSHAVERFYFTVNYEIIECVYKYGPKLGAQCFEKHPGYTISDLLTHPIYFMLCGLLLAMIMIVLINRRKKIYFLNTLIVCALYLIVHLSGLFKFYRDLDLLLISFAGIFSNKFWAMNLIEIHVYLLSALLFIWFSVKNRSLEKST